VPGFILLSFATACGLPFECYRTTRTSYQLHAVMRGGLPNRINP